MEKQEEYAKTINKVYGFLSNIYGKGPNEKPEIFFLETMDFSSEDLTKNGFYNVFLSMDDFYQKSLDSLIQDAEQRNETFFEIFNGFIQGDYRSLIQEKDYGDEEQLMKQIRDKTGHSLSINDCMNLIYFSNRLKNLDDFKEQYRHKMFRGIFVNKEFHEAKEMAGKGNLDKTIAHELIHYIRGKKGQKDPYLGLDRILEQDFPTEIGKNYEKRTDLMTWERDFYEKTATELAATLGSLLYIDYDSDSLSEIKQRSNYNFARGGPSKKLANDLDSIKKMLSRTKKISKDNKQGGKNLKHAFKQTGYAMGKEIFFDYLESKVSYRELLRLVKSETPEIIRFIKKNYPEFNEIAKEYINKLLI